MDEGHNRRPDASRGTKQARRYFNESTEKEGVHCVYAYVENETKNGFK